MAPPKYTPDKNTFERWLAEDPRPTHQQMADRIYAETGHRITRAAVTLALMQYGLSESRPRYKQTLPWRVKLDHIKAYPARMLRLLGRRQQGGKMTEKENELLDSWLSNLETEQLIVAYDPEDNQGFHYIDQSFKDHDDPDLPIRKKTLHLNKV